MAGRFEQRGSIGTGYEFSARGDRVDIDVTALVEKSKENGGLADLKVRLEANPQGRIIAVIKSDGRHRLAAVVSARPLRAS